jgi:hypothetical protein
MISTRYEKAMENVDSSLREVSRSLQKLFEISEKNGQSSIDPTSQSSVHNCLPTTTDTSEGHGNDPPFAVRVEETPDFFGFAGNTQFSNVTQANLRTTPMNQQANNERSTPGSSNVQSSSFNPYAHIQISKLSSKLLPPLDQTLKLLRLAQTNKQRFFLDIAFVDEQEFGRLCQNVYFAIDEYSVWAWMIVNAGLYYLFLGVGEQAYSQVGIQFSEIHSYSQLLSANIDATMQSLKLWQDPSLEVCQALALLVTRPVYRHTTWR